MALSPASELDTLDVNVHDHLSLFYNTREEQFRAVVPFIRAGLQNGELCLYIADENSGEAVRDVLEQGGIDVAAAEASGSFLMTGKDETYLRRGYFEPEAMFEFLHETVTCARSAGYPAVRAAAEMTWALGGDPGAERLVEYESRLDVFFQSHEILAMCQYNRSRFQPDAIKNIILTHPKVIYGGHVCDNFYFMPPHEFLHPDRQAMEVERILQNLLLHKQYQTQILKANAAKDEFLGLVSHEIKTPITMILGNADLLARGVSMSETDRLTAFADIHTEAQRLSRIVNNLLVLARLEQGKRLDLEPLLLQRLAPTIVDDYVKHAPGRQFEMHLDEQAPPALGDADYFEQVLLNLLSNADKYSPHDSPVDIEVTAPDGHICLSIADRGPGIAEDELDLVFRPFYRSAKTLSSDGVGIGLAVCQRLVEAQAGEIWAERREGGGTVFRIQLPVSTEGCTESLADVPVK